MKLTIVPLDPDFHDRGAFCCGHEGVDYFFRHTAGQAAKYFKSQTFVLIATETPTRILGFYTLAQCSYRDGELDPTTARALKVAGLSTIPMILLGQLGIVKEFQGKGLGKMLLWNSLERSYAVAGEIGGVAMVTDPNDATAAAFYARYAFETLHTEPFQRMILPMKTIKRALAGRSVVRAAQLPQT